MEIITLPVASEKRNQMIDITNDVKKEITASKIQSGLCFIYVPHTTGAVTINENADPTVQEDILDKLNQLVPVNNNYKHAEGNADSHIKASLTGNSCVVFIAKGQPVLGTWQGIFFCEFDGPRRRKIFIKIISG